MISRSAIALAFAALLSAVGATFAGELRFETAQNYDRPPADIDEPDTPTPQRELGGLGTRVDRLERELRNMTGRVEELQHTVQVLEEQLRAARQDNARPVAAPPPAASGKRGDAFDPNSNPGAPGAPREIGSTSPSTPLPSSRSAASGPLREPGAPLDLTGHLTQTSPAIIAPADGAPAPPTVKEDYDQAVALMRSGQYESAEKSSGGLSREIS